MWDNEKQNKKETVIHLVVMVIVVILGGLVISSKLREDREIDRIGTMLCEKYGMEFWYASGSTIRCYVQDDETAIKQAYKFWVDIELAKEIYLGEKSD